jgi:hypothetical protein
MTRCRLFGFFLLFGLATSPFAGSAVERRITIGNRVVFQAERYDTLFYI